MNQWQHRQNEDQLFPRTPLLAGTQVEAKRQELLDYFHPKNLSYPTPFA